MPKTLTAQNIRALNSIQFQVKDNAVTAMVCQAEVNFGTLGINQTIDLWPLLTPGQQTKIQDVYNVITALLQRELVGGAT